MFNRIGSFWLAQPCFDIPDSGGGGGSETTGDSGFSGGTENPTAPAEPTVYDVNDDSLIRIPGRTEPVKFGEHYRGFQSQFTKASQEAARLKKELAARDTRIAEIERAQREAQYRQQQPQTQKDPYGDLRTRPYLTGEEAAQVVENLTGEFGKRDQLTVQLVQRLLNLEKQLGGLNESHSTNAFEGLISKTINQLGMPPEAADWAKEVYLAYEGDDLNSEFPQILQNRWDQLQRLYAAQQASKVSAARKPPFVPGRGSTAGPSRPLQMDPKLSAMEVADQLHHLFADENQT